MENFCHVANIQLSRSFVLGENAFIVTMGDVLIPYSSGGNC
jgi:hypothetical protein